MLATRDHFQYDGALSRALAELLPLDQASRKSEPFVAVAALGFWRVGCDRLAIMGQAAARTVARNLKFGSGQ